MAQLMKVLLCVFVWFVASQCTGRTQEEYVPDTGLLEAAYEQYREPSINHRRFKHADIEPLITRRMADSVFDVVQLGVSVLKKPIYQLRFGDGPRRVMMWSQMHGDEPTATMALMDLFNFLEGNGDGMDSIRQLLREQTSIYFIPMLNPDGADVYTRRNAMDVDLNRDAREGATVEGSILIQAAKTVRPRYAFNLHDQNIYYNVPGTTNPVTVALLAPAYNEARDINDVRAGAMKIAVGMNRVLQQFIPQGVAKYDDTYTPRGFGDNFQSWGASTVLVESGGYKGDPEKQYIRKLNFMIILNALIEIAQGSYQQYDIDEYHALPFNQTGMTDLMLRNLRVQRDDVPLVVDVSIRRSEITQDTAYYVHSRIDDIGDLRDSHGYDEIDASGYEFIQGRVYPTPFPSIDHITPQRVLELLRTGYIAVQVQQLPESRIHGLPLQIFHHSPPTPASINLGREANFYLGRGGELHYAIVNGYLVDLSQDSWGSYFNYIR